MVERKPAELQRGELREGERFDPVELPLLRNVSIRGQLESEPPKGRLDHDLPDRDGAQANIVRWVGDGFPSVVGQATIEVPVKKGLAFILYICIV